MSLDLQKFYKACEPSRTLNVGNAEERRYFIDFSSVRGGRIVEALGRTITRLSPDSPTCQLFTGHIGCGKSTELLRLKAQLEQEGFHVIYFSSSQDLDMADVDVSDILLAIARQVSASLEAMQIKFQPTYFAHLFTELAEFLHIALDLAQNAQFSLSLAKITEKAKDSPQIRSQLRQYLEPRTNSILQALNEEILGQGIKALKQQGKNGLVVIIDNLDRVDNRPTSWGRSQPEYIFVDRGEQLSQLNCHLVYTVPLSLIFSNESETLKLRLGGGLDPKVLPMVPVRLRDGTESQEGMTLLRQMVLARAFPDLEPMQRLDQILEVFDSPDTLDRMCQVSGGHVRNLLGLLYRCLQEEDPPLSRDCLEEAIRESRNRLLLALTDSEWELLFQVVQDQTVRGDAEYQTLLRSLFVFEYRDKLGSWFSINPVLAETEKFMSWQ